MDLTHETPAVTAARARKKVQPLVGWLVYRRLSLPLAVRLSRTRIMPNHVTASALAFGIAGAACLASGSYRWAVAGAALANLAMVADGVDGELARAKGVGSASGYVLDTFCDRTRDVALLAGCGIGAARAGDGTAETWTIAAIATYLLFFYLSSISPAHWREARHVDDLDIKHMLAWRHVRVGIGDSLAALIAVASIAGSTAIVVHTVAICSPAAMAMKVRHLRRLRPWANDAGRDAGPMGRPTGGPRAAASGERGSMPNSVRQPDTDSPRGPRGAT